MIILAVLAAVSIILYVDILRRSFRRFFRALRKGRKAYLFLAPSLLLILIFCYYPIFTAFMYSFTNFRLSQPLEFIGLKNYSDMLKDPYFFPSMKNMLYIVLTSILKDLTMPLLVAELVFWLKNQRHKYLLRTAFVVPSIVPGMVVTLMWRMFYEPNIGLVNQLIQLFTGQPFQKGWLGDERLAIWSVIFSGFPWISIFAFLVYFGGLINISRDIYESAQLDGIRPMRRFLSIDKPMLRYQFRLVIFFSFLGSVQTYSDIYVLTQGGPGHATYVPALQMFMQISQGANFGYASALGVVLFLIVMIGTGINFAVNKEE